MCLRCPFAIALVPLLLLLLIGSACSREAAAPSLPAPADVASPPPDALKTTSGLSIKTLQQGTGTRRARATDQVTVHYTGWTTDGKMFESSVTRGEPSTFALDAVIPGWTEAVQRMVEGEKVRVWIPEPLAYDGAPGKPAGMLVFDIELIRIGG